MRRGKFTTKYPRLSSRGGADFINTLRARQVGADFPEISSWFVVAGSAHPNSLLGAKIIYKPAPTARPYQRKMMPADMREKAKSQNHFSFSLLPLFRHAPNLDGVIQAATDDCLPVWTDGHTINRIGVSFEGAFLNAGG